MRSILILTEPKHAVVLLSIVEVVSPDATVTFVSTLAELEAFIASSPAVDRLIAFCTAVVVPARILDAIGSLAYNIHPGPPEYPGRYPAPFALYDGARRFGATAHVMLAKVDSGPIVGQATFEIEAGTDLTTLNSRTYKAALKLFIRLCSALVRSTEPLPVLPISWTGRASTRRDLERLVNVASDISADEFERRHRAFGQMTECSLTLHWHGRRFRLA